MTKFNIYDIINIILKEFGNILKSPPPCENKRIENKYNMAKFKKKKAVDNTAHILTSETNFSVAEAYKAIRANINFAIPKQGCKKVMICSSYSNEGKTTTSVNLALTIAQTNATVLLIDCDLRRASVHKYLNITDNEIGISSYLSNMATLEQIVKDTDVPNVKVITSGIIPPNPAELLAGPKMKELLHEVETATDYVIIDTPPLCIVSDALPLSKLCDGVILIVNHMETTHPHIKESLEKLSFAGANVAGMILNKIKINRTYKSYKKYGKYNYYTYENDEKD